MAEYEDKDIAVGKVRGFALALVVTCLLLAVAMGAALRVLNRVRPHGGAPDTFSQQAAFAGGAGPRLQAYPEREFAAWRAGQDAQLHSYGWVDRPAGVVRLPIERAMEVLAEKGGTP